MTGNRLSDHSNLGIYLGTLIAIFFGCAILSVIIPPFQSPDEHDHIKRAYLLNKGIIALNREEGKSSGGHVDSGLIKYMEHYGVIKGKLSKEAISSGNMIKWSGHRVYSPTPGTGYYFPAIYLPQASGLWIGESLDLSVDHSYRIARAFALGAAALLLFGAFLLHPPNPLAIALIAIPMTLFQMSSASIDGVSNALAIFAISAFLKITKNSAEFPSWTQLALAAAIAVLATSRIQTLPMLLLLAAIHFYTKDRKSLVIFCVTALFVLGWTAFAIKSTVDLRVSIGEPTTNILKHYLINPLQFLEVVWQTLEDEGTREFYWKSFFGILGWLDTPFQNWHYTKIFLLFSAIALLTPAFENLKYEWPERLLLLLVSALSVLLIFFALLVTWTPHPAKLISGVQGRYLVIPLIIFSYSIAGSSGFNDGIRRNVANLIAFILFAFSVLMTTDLLINRYYLTEPDTLVIGQHQLGNQKKMMPSAELSRTNPLKINLPALDEKTYGEINRIGIMFGTHMRKNPGEAELKLTTKSGLTHRIKFPIHDLTDNAYEYFSIPEDHYTSGEVIFFSGGGISIWEIHAGEDKRLSCSKFGTSRNQTLTIDGCP